MAQDVSVQVLGVLLAFFSAEQWLFPCLLWHLFRVLDRMKGVDKERKLQERAGSALLLLLLPSPHLKGLAGNFI